MTHSHPGVAAWPRFVRPAVLLAVIAIAFGSTLGSARVAEAVPAPPAAAPAIVGRQAGDEPAAPETPQTARHPHPTLPHQGGGDRPLADATDTQAAPDPADDAPLPPQGDSAGDDAPPAEGVAEGNAEQQSEPGEIEAPPRAEHPDDETQRESAEAGEPQAEPEPAADEPAATDDEPAAAAEADDEPGSFFKLLVVLAFLAVPYLLAIGLTRLLRLPEYRMRVAVVLFAIELAAAPLLLRDNPIPLGIDLAGGTRLVFHVDEAKLDPGESVDMEEMARVITMRINPAGQSDVSVRPVGDTGVEVVIPRRPTGAQQAAEVRRVIDVITHLGQLEFRIAANERDHPEIIDLGTEAFDEAMQELSAAAPVESDEIPITIPVRDPAGEVVADWVRLHARPPQPRVRPDWEIVDRDEFGAPPNDEGIVPVTGQIAVRVGEPPADPETGEPVRYMLLVRLPEDEAVTGEFLDRAYADIGSGGQRVVGFQFDTEGGIRFGNLTREYAPEESGGHVEFRRRLAVVLGSRVYSAPYLNDVIRDRGIIEGPTGDEIDELVRVLNAGALPAALDDQPDEMSVGPGLGSDTIAKGIRASFWALVLVLTFMATYYLFAGAVANFCLLLNLLLLMGAMSFVEATFTLPGVAALVLTMGMAVDANVLIYERMREELGRGSTLRLAVRNGFDKAWTAITDANVTTLITAAILYAIGTTEVRGFAVTLFIGILASLFAAVFVGRLVFELYERRRKELSAVVGALAGLGLGAVFGVYFAQLTGALIGAAVGLVVGALAGTTLGSRGPIPSWGLPRPNFNFLRWKWHAMTASLVLVVIGMAALVARGRDNLAIDFTGGMQAGIRLTERTTADEVRETIADYQASLASAAETVNAGIPDATVMDLILEDQPPGTRFLITTTNDDEEAVSAALAEAFGDRLVHLEMRLPARVNELAAGDAHDGTAPAPATDTAQTPVPPDTGEGAPTPPEDRSFRIEFSEQVSTAAISDQIDAELERLLPEGRSPAGLYELKGVEGGDIGEENEFSAMLFTASPELDLPTAARALLAAQAYFEGHPLLDPKNVIGAEGAIQMQEKAVFAIIASLIAVAGYLWLRFQKIGYGLAAVVAVFHDVLVGVGAVAIAAFLSETFLGPALGLDPFKIDLNMIAAFLTLVGYSLNDTIVIFDRVREVRGRNPHLTPEMVNTSLNQTLSRTILTNFTVLLVVLVLYIFGGEGIHGFAFVMLVGAFTGTYSTVFIASPVLLWLRGREETGREGRRLDRSARTAAVR